MVRVGMADVFAMIRVWCGLVGVFGVAVAFGFTGGVARPADPVLGLGLVVSAGLFAATEARVAAGLVAAVGMVVYLGPVPSTMTVLIVMVSTALALFDGEDLRLVLRVQAGVVYLFAGLNKLWPPFLSGEVFDRWVRLPDWPVILVGVVVTEIVLGVLILRGWRDAPYAVVALHLPMIPLVSIDPFHAVTMATYAGMMLWTVTAALSGPDLHRPRPPLRRRPGAADDDPARDRTARDAVTPCERVRPG